MDSCWRSSLRPLPLRVGMVMQEERWRGRKRSSSVLLHSLLLPLVFWLQQQFFPLYFIFSLPYLLVYESFHSSLCFPAFSLLLLSFSHLFPQSIFRSHSMAIFYLSSPVFQIAYIYTIRRRSLTARSGLVRSHQKRKNDMGAKANLSLMLLLY